MLKLSHVLVRICELDLCLQGHMDDLNIILLSIPHRYYKPNTNILRWSSRYEQNRMPGGRMHGICWFFSLSQNVLILNYRTCAFMYLPAIVTAELKLEPAFVFIYSCYLAISESIRLVYPAMPS